MIETAEDRARKEWAATKWRYLRQVSDDNTLPPSAFKVAYNICDKIDSRTKDKVYPYGQDTLAQLVGIRVRQLRVLLGQLVAAGHLAVRRRGYPKSDLYTILVKPNSSAPPATAGAPNVSKGDRHLNAARSERDRGSDRHLNAGVTGTKMPPLPCKDISSSNTTTLRSETTRACPTTERSGSGAGDAADEGAEADALKRDFAALLKAYPFDDDLMNRDDALEGFAALSIADRPATIRAAEQYRIKLAKNRRDFPLSLANWLRKRPLASISPPEPADHPGRPIAAGRVFVAHGSAAWAAWVAAGHPPGLSSASGPDGRTRGWWFATAFPPGAGAGSDATPRAAE